MERTRKTTLKQAPRLPWRVGIVPEATFVEKVAGDLVDVIVLSSLPRGNSPANYQPTTTEMQALSDAEVYFTLQMPTEQANILPNVGSFNEDVKIVDLREAAGACVPTFEPGWGSASKRAEKDLLIRMYGFLQSAQPLWVQTIADELSEIDGENQETYQANAADYIAELEAL